MKNLLFIFSVLLIIYSCSSDSNNDEVDVPKIPTVTNLIFPFENSLCNVGTNITATESTVLFEWEASDNTDSYELELTNLATGSVTTHQAINTETSIVLKRGTPYSWYVISKSNAVTEIAQSATWKFYNAGEAIMSYAPFPAEVISPAMAASVTTTAVEITLDWNGNDVDDDIVGYDLYFDTISTPNIIKIDLEESTFNVSIEVNTIYYWKIITKDSRGNTSDSGVFQFKIL